MFYVVEGWIRAVVLLLLYLQALSFFLPRSIAFSITFFPVANVEVGVPGIEKESHGIARGPKKKDMQCIRSSPTLPRFSYACMH